MDDNALVHVALNGRRPYFDALREAANISGLKEPQREQVEFCVALIQRLHAQKDALGPAAVIEALMDETAFAASLLCQFHGVRRLANVQRLLETARLAAAVGLHGLADFVRQFRQQVMGSLRFEQAAVLGEDEDVVRLMTIHKAKGLEFPVVFIPDLNRGRKNVRERLIYQGRPARDVPVRRRRRRAPQQPGRLGHGEPAIRGRGVSASCTSPSRGTRTTWCSSAATCGVRAASRRAATCSKSMPRAGCRFPPSQTPERANWLRPE